MKIKELFSDKDKWTRGAFALNKHGQKVEANDKNAVCWCLLGAIRKCYSGDLKQAFVVYRRILDEIINQRGFCIGTWNDEIAQYKDVKDLVEKLDV